MTSLGNSRRNPIQPTAVSWRLMDLEYHEILEFDELPGVYGIRLQDFPNTATIAIYEDATGYTGTGFTGLTEFDQITSGLPSIGQYRLGGGLSSAVIFNSGDVGKNVIVDYEGGGSSISLENILSVIQNAKAVANSWTASTTYVEGELVEYNDIVYRCITAHTSTGSFDDTKFFGGAPDGSAATPGMFFNDDPDNGLYRIGANNLGISIGGSKVGEFNSNGFQGLRNIAIFSDEKTNGTSGGTFTNGAWRTRDINTTNTNTINGCSLSSNQITLAAGTYLIKAKVPAYQVNSHKGSLYNTTDASYTLYGTSESAGNGAYDPTHSFIEGIFTIAGSKVFEIKHICQSSISTNGFGLANSFSVPEIYTQIYIERLA